MPIDIEAVNSLIQDSVKAGREFYRLGSDANDQDFKRARIAATNLSAGTRLIQTIGAQRVAEVSLASRLFTDDQMQEYVRRAMPESVIARMLPVPTEHTDEPSL